MTRGRGETPWRRIALGAVADRPMRASEAEALLAAAGQRRAFRGGGHGRGDRSILQPTSTDRARTAATWPRSSWTRPGPGVGTGATLSGILRSPFAGGLVAFALAPRSAWAGHSYTELYNPFYVVGVGLVVIVSFVVVAVFLGRATRAGRRATTGSAAAGDTGSAGAGRHADRARLAVASFALLVVAGFGGSRIETWNPAPTGSGSPPGSSFPPCRSWPATSGA